MARELRAFAATIPAGTPATAPVAVSLAMPPRIVQRVEVVVPPGCNGAVGFALGSGGQPVLPYNAGAFIVASGETIGWDLDGQISSGAWQVIGYNTGVNDHTLYLRFLLGLVTDPSAANPAPALLPDAALSPINAADLAMLGAGPIA